LAGSIRKKRNNMNNLSNTNDAVAPTLTQAEMISQHCFRMPGLATKIEDFVGRYMQQREGAYERDKKEQERAKALHTRKRREDGTRVLKLLRVTIFRDAGQIAEALSMDREHANNIILDLLTARRIRRQVMGGRDVYCLMK
jgi:hypothetical protein